MSLFKKTLSILILILSVLISLNAKSQIDEEQGKRQKKIKALYVAFVSQELNLTESEAQQFWPVHSEYEKEIKAANEKKLPELEREETVLTIKKKYVERFKKILGPERTDSFFRKDGEFRKKLVERIKEHRMQNGFQPDGGVDRMKGRRLQNGFGPGGGRNRKGMMQPPPAEY
ncbi:MAG: hypothetical protein FGM46_04815 [Ferruginibacter sp.]|nr:hypothetical protein [Ferruginibacter sp.]